MALSTRMEQELHEPLARSAAGGCRPRRIDRHPARPRSAASALAPLAVSRATLGNVEGPRGRS